MLPYLDSLKLVMDSSDYYSGAGEFKEFKKFSKIWEPRLGANGTFESFYEAQSMYYNNLSENYDYITPNKWLELGPNRLNYIPGRTGIGPVEAITFFDNGTLELTRYMLASSLMGGLFFSEDSGDSWKSGGTDSWIQSGCGWAVFHPADYNTWFASSSGNGTSGQSLWIGNGGIYRTTNKGDEWIQIANHVDLYGEYTTIYKLLIDPVDTNVLFAATSKGIFRTTNCNTVATPENPDPVIWERVCDYLTYDLEMKPDNHNVLYASCYINQTTGWQLTRSVNNGLHFYSLPNQPGVVTDNELEKSSFTIEVSKAKPDFLYSDVRINNSHSYYYYDFALNTNWITIKTGVTSAMGWGHGFGVDQAVNGERIIVSGGTSGIRLTGFNLNGSLFSVDDPVHVDVEDVIFHPYNVNEVWTCTHGGVEKSVETGQNWQAKYEGLGVAMVEQMATSYTDPGLMLVGLYHDGVQLTQTPYQQDWNPNWTKLLNFGVDGMLPLIDNKNPQHMWGSGQKGMWRYSSNGMQSSQEISLMNSAYWETRGVLNKQNTSVFFRNKLYSGSLEEVFRSSNRGLSGENVFISNFRSLLPGSTDINILGFKTPFNNGNYILAWLFNKVPGNSKAVYRLFRTTNANAPVNSVSWQELEIPRPDWISGVEFDPENPDIIYLSYGRSTNDNASEQMIFRIDYTNPTAPFTTDITKNLPVAPSYDNSIALQRGSNRGVYFATEFGVFYTDNNLLQKANNEWSLVGKGLPNVIPHGIELNYISNTLRVGTYGRGVWEIPLPCINNSTPLVISQNTTWDSYMRLDRSVKVNYMTTLTITEDARIAMPADARIIVEPGGKLIVNGGVITSGCDYPWQGIEVWGNSAQHQWPNTNGTYMQGYVELNNATIENAVCALNLWKPGDYTKTGGIVIANNSDFRNNRESVHALLYENHHPVNGKPMDYQAIFNNCTFNITDAYNPANTFFKHVDLYQVSGVRFNGCDFSLSPEAQGVSDFNHAIASYSSGFKVNAICEVAGQNGCIDYDPCTFTGFRNAITANNGSLNTNTFYVNRAEFNNNSIGIEVNSVWNPIIINSNFYLSKNQFSPEQCSYGIYLEKSIGFAIEENKFFKADGASLADYFGIGSINCETVSEIYKNEFTGLSAGNYAYGKNFPGLYAVKGLTYLCNKNTGNWADFYINGKVGTNYGIQHWQGNTTQPAGNTFTLEGANWHIYNEKVNPIIYHHCSTCPDEIPVKIGYVSLVPVNTPNSCPSHYGGHSGRDVVMNVQQKLDREFEFAVASLNYENVETLFNQLKDGGSTIEKEIEINTSTSADMWSLRAELLGDSPHLSKEVLKLVADKTDVFTESVIFDILAANPDELRGEELLKYVAEKEIPLPEYMIDILREIATGTTYKTVLQQEMARYIHDRTRSANDMIRSILNEDELDVIQLRNWLSNLGGIESDKQIIATYLQEGNFSAAFALANTFPQMYNLQQNELTEHGRYMSLLQLEQSLVNEGRKLDQLTQSEQNMLNEYALASEGSSGAQAKGILESFYGADFNDCKSLDGEESYKNTIVNPNLLGEAYGLSISVKPNPASEWAVIDYTLPHQESVAVLEITDANGNRIETMNLSGNQGQKLWDTRNIPSGSYIITIKVAGFLKSVKLIVSK